MVYTQELSNIYFLTKHLYSKEGDDESYLEMKHDRYNACQEEEKLDYAKNNHSSMNIQVDTDESGEDTHNY